jgi:hypothetical protein
MQHNFSNSLHDHRARVVKKLFIIGGGYLPEISSSFSYRNKKSAKAPKRILMSRFFNGSIKRTLI